MNGGFWGWSSDSSTPPASPAAPWTRRDRDGDRDDDGDEVPSHPLPTSPPWTTYQRDVELINFLDTDSSVVRLSFDLNTTFFYSSPSSVASDTDPEPEFSSDDAGLAASSSSAMTAATSSTSAAAAEHQHELHRRRLHAGGFSLGGSGGSGGAGLGLGLGPGLGMGPGDDPHHDRRDRAPRHGRVRQQMHQASPSSPDVGRLMGSMRSMSTSTTASAAKGNGHLTRQEFDALPPAIQRKVSRRRNSREPPLLYPVYIEVLSACLSFPFCRFRNPFQPT